MFNINQKSGEDLLKDSAKGAIPFLFWASMTITAIGFTILLGGLEMFLKGVAQDNTLQMLGGIFISIIAGFLGYGFVRTELGINLMYALKGKVPPIAVVALVFIIATNLIVGIYRSNTKSSTDTYALTQKVAQEDIIIQDLRAQKDSIQTNVYHDGAPSNDASAAKQIGQLNEKIETRSAQLVGMLKPVGDGTYNLFVLGILGFLSFVFSAAIQIAYHDEQLARNVASAKNAQEKRPYANPARENHSSVDTSALIAKITQAGIEKAQFAQIVKDAVFASVRANETKFYTLAARSINEEYELDVNRAEVRVFFVQETGLRNRREIVAFLDQHEHA